jgi:hypothetical protein
MRSRSASSSGAGARLGGSAKAESFIGPGRRP